MPLKTYIQQAEANGWRVSLFSGAQLHLRCDHVGCPSHHLVELKRLGEPPERCLLPHKSEYGLQAISSYESFTSLLRRRRHELALSQEQLCRAGGFADGHINKLEAGDRLARFPTIQLWAQCLGWRLAFLPAPLPIAIIREIEHSATFKAPHSLERHARAARGSSGT